MTMRNLGLSIYPSHSRFEDDRRYLELGAKYGFSRIFMSLLEVRGSAEETKERFRKIIAAGNELGYQTFIDVNPALFSRLGVTTSDLSFFSDLGVAGIRLDQSFDGITEAAMSFNEQGLIIELNMSSDVDYLNNIMSFRPNAPFIYGCHNFYPQKGTGLDYDFFMKCSARFRRYGIHTAAFVSSAAGSMGPWNVNDGLPTLEADRGLPIDVQARHLFATNMIDDVIIGNAYATEEELAALAAVNRYQLILGTEFEERTSELERRIALEEKHLRRGDVNALTVRSSGPRVKYRDCPNPPHDNEVVFHRGDILIGNDDFGVYRNELQIALKDHEDPRKNRIGRIAADELFLLDFIEPWCRFGLVER